MKKVTLSEIPVITFPEPANYLDLALKLKANGKNAIIFISVQAVKILKWVIMAGVMTK